MEERNRNNDQQSNEKTIQNLKRLRTIAEEQSKSEFVDAISAALKALGSEDQAEDKGDGLRLSGTASDQLLQLAQQVREGTATPQQKHQAANYLASLAGGKR